MTNGSASLSADGWSIVYVPNQNYNGPAAIEYTVTDEGGLSASGTITVNVTPENDQPIAQSATFTTLEDTPVAFDLNQLATDLETPVEQLTFNFLTWGGTIDINGSTATFTPANDVGGESIEIWFQVTDPEGLESWATVTFEVQAVNDAPTANSLLLSGTEDTEVWIFRGDLVGDEETPLEDLQITIDSVTNGTAALSQDGWSLVFQPEVNFSGLAAIHYTVTDAGGLSASGVVTIDIAPVNDDPVALFNSFTTQVSTPVTFDLNQLAYDLESPIEQLTFNFFTWGGDIVINGTTATFTPAADVIGESIEIWFQVLDPDGLEAWASLTFVVTV